MRRFWRNLGLEDLPLHATLGLPRERLPPHPQVDARLMALAAIEMLLHVAVVAAAEGVVRPTATMLGPAAMPLEFCLEISSHPDLHVGEVHLHGVSRSSMRVEKHAIKSMGRLQSRGELRPYWSGNDPQPKITAGPFGCLP